MDDRHREYTEYYEARLARRREQAELYPDSVAAEQAIYDAIAGAATLEEFGPALEAGNLTFAASKARVVDQARARLAVWEELGEPVRASEEAQILAEAPATTDEAGLMEVVQRAHKAAREAITVDEFHRMFIDDLETLENIEVYERAEVPERWQQEFSDHVDDLIERGTADFAGQMAELHKFVPAAEFDLDVVLAPRHRRLAPFPDDVVARRFETFQRYRGLA